MKCIAVDDEPLALQIIEDYAKKIPFINLEKNFTSALDAVSYINNHMVDLIFLDIQMPNLTGIEFIKSLANPPMIIFTTAYNQFALQGYELNVLDYLLKPFAFERFLQAINKANEIFQLKKRADKNSSISYTNDFLLVKADYQTYKIELGNIISIESMADYIRIFTKEKKYTVLTTLKSIESMLPPAQFIRIHRSYIIAINKIVSYNKRSVHIGDADIPIGESYKENFENFLNNRTIG